MSDKFFKDSVNNLRPYKISDFDIWSENRNYLKLDWNESTIPPSPKVLSAIKKLIDESSLNWYPPLFNKLLLELLADYNNVEIMNVQYFAGSDSFQEYLIQTCIEPNDIVTIISPTYDNFRVVVESYGGIIENYNLGSNFSLNEENLYSFIKDKNPKVVYICNPNNPTGTVYTFEFCERIIRDFQDTLFIFDEAYFEFSGITVSSLVNNYSNFIISRTFSKAFGLASFRIGYAIGPKEIIDTINKVRNPKNIALISQVAAIESLKDIDYMHSFTFEVDNSKSLLEDFLVNQGVHFNSCKGNYIMIKADSFKKSDMINFLHKRDILVRDLGHLDQLSNFFRITIGTVEQTKTVIKNLDRFLNNQ
tara:strand:+ start:1274 stop:2362 length:1089 start_codon:yes stop_codon:yes gene_type:complete